MDKLLEMLGVQKIDESEQKVIKEKLETLIEMKAKAAVNEMLKEEKAKLIESYEQKFDAYKEDITSKFSNFVDGILDEQMVIPEKIMEYARKGELYSDLIEQFKVRLAIDEGLLDNEVKSLLKEAKTEIQSLRSKLDSSIAENLQTQSDAQDLAAELYISKKCDGLTESQKKRVMQVLEGLKDRSEIDKKFAIIIEAKMADDEENEDEEEEKKKGMDNPEEEEEEEEEEKKKGKDNKKEEEKEKNESKKGKGKVINEDKTSTIDENANDPFSMSLRSYLKVLQENRV
jgi:hypothetical protein